MAYWLSGIKAGDGSDSGTVASFGPPLGSYTFFVCVVLVLVRVPWTVLARRQSSYVSLPVV